MSHPGGDISTRNGYQMYPRTTRGICLTSIIFTLLIVCLHHACQGCPVWENKQKTQTTTTTKKQQQLGTLHTSVSAQKITPVYRPNKK